jgi:hypothetical protein
MKCQIDIPQELDKDIRQYMLNTNCEIKSKAIITILEIYFQNAKKTNLEAGC